MAHFLVFLDVDGVLNSVSYYNTVDSITKHPLDPAAIKRLKQLLDEAGRGGATVHVILTSSWRTGWNKDPALQDHSARVLENALAMNGIRIYDRTGFSGRADRPGEVIEFLRTYPYKVDGLVILDDANFFWNKYHLEDMWLKTDFHEEGLSEAMIPEALRILKEPPWWLKLFQISKKTFREGMENP